jgi:membrane protease YdiL (CAAX protease family)
MYEEKKKSDVAIAIIAFVLHFLALCWIGIVNKYNLGSSYHVYEITFIVSCLIVIIKERDLTNLGFGKEKIKVNLPIAIGIIVVTFIISIFMSDSPVSSLLSGAIHMLVFTAFVEEVLFRGIIQNYLMISSKNRIVLYIIGAVCFAVSHMPLHFINRHGGLSMWLQLVFTFLLHLIYCFIASKRKDVTILIAIHFAIDYLPDLSYF